MFAPIPFFYQDANGNEPPLYDVWGTNYKAMDEFGIGVGLYYRQLMLLGVVSIFAAAVDHTPALLNTVLNVFGHTSPFLSTALNLFGHTPPL